MDATTKMCGTALVRSARRGVYAALAVGLAIAAMASPRPEQAPARCSIDSSTTPAWPWRARYFTSTGARGVHEAVAVLGPAGSPVAQLHRGTALSFEELEIAARGAAADAGAVRHLLRAGGLRLLLEVAYDHLERRPIQSFGQHRHGRGADRRVHVVDIRLLDGREPGASLHQATVGFERLTEAGKAERLDDVVQRATLHSRADR